MILPQRERHRQVFTLLGVVLPVALVVGITFRRSVPANEALPLGIVSPKQTFTATDLELHGRFANPAIRARLWREQNSGRLAVDFSAPKDFLKPDLLVYWVAGQSGKPDGLPEAATLLGAFVAGPLELPPEATTTEGSFVLFSLADQEIVDVSKPFVAANVNSRQADMEDGCRLTSAAREK